MANVETPLMRQYSDVKSRFSDSLLFFRMGDFYELFFNDALVAAKALEIALTSRNKNDPDPIPMCGVPHHAATNYVNRLVSAGHKVAICEQLEDPSQAKGIVRRDVIRVVSPGTRLDPEALDAKVYNYTHAVWPASGGGTFVHWATCDFTTGSFWFGTSRSIDEWFSFAQSQGFAEVLFSENEVGRDLLIRWQEQIPNVFAQTVPVFYFDKEYAADRIREQFSVTSLNAVHPELSAFGEAAGALIKYFQETQKAPRIPSAIRIDRWGKDETMELDAATVRSLELIPTKTSRDVSLLSWIDRTKTAMGGRMLREWLLRPLLNRARIEERLDEVEGVGESYATLTPVLNEIYDLERLLSRLSLGGGVSATPRELLALSQSVVKASGLDAALGQIGPKTSPQASRGLAILHQAASKAQCPELLALAREVLDGLNTENVPPNSREGRIFKKGFRTELDTLIDLSENGEQWLVQFEAEQRKSTAIQSLKVRYNRVFGYYIEITKANLGSVPAHYVRKQTMVGGERFITEELKQFEEKILTAEKKRCDLEHALFRGYCAKYVELSAALIKTAGAVAHVDAIASLASLACEDGYRRPTLTDTFDLEIVHGRHPTVSNMVRSFVPNSVMLTSTHPFLIITGPNMGGKSTVMRQTALITLMAHLGSFVPAEKATIGLVDRIFTRIGAADNIAEGESTFMVEMSEMSFILRHATKRSLILIDEIGRGTSTYDGMSLAWALAADLIERLRARTLFATHYHELTQLAESYTGAANARVAVALTDSNRKDHGIKFLYRLEPGMAERSYGILVARLAGLPDDVLGVAHAMLEQLEAQARRLSNGENEGDQLSFRLNLSRPSITPSPCRHDRPEPTAGEAVVASLRAVDLNNLTPMRALNLLWEWREILAQGERR